MDNSSCRNIDGFQIITTNTGKKVEARIDIWEDDPDTPHVRLLPQTHKPYQRSRPIKLNHDEAAVLALALNKYLDWYKDSLARKTIIGG